LVEWRRDSRFRVEQPGLVLTSARDEEAEARDGPVLALALRTLAQRQSVSITLVDVADAGSRDERPLLNGPAAARLRELTARRNYPPQAPVAVAVAINRDGLLNRPGLLPEEREARRRFAEEAWNEERMVAGAAALRAEGAFTGHRPSLILLQAATFLRAWNQEEPWLPGDAGPTARELEARFGLAGIRFDDDLPEEWRQYYLSMLGRSLGDLHRVLPALSLRGLNIRIGDLPIESNALALHEPRTRTLYLPPTSGAGTLAHELAHDLDWQLARRRYGARGGYATDMAVRDRRGDRIAAAMMELSFSLVQPTTEVPLTPHMTRPAEVFARGVDWLVAAVLARDGRLGGYLTSFQDPILTGYGTTRGPDITGGAVPALLSILDGAAPVAEPLREWVLDTYGPNRSLTATEVARAVTDAGAGLPPAQRLQAIEAVGARSFEAVSDCRFGSADAMRRLVGAQRALAAASVSAAARGAAIEGVHALAEAQVGPQGRELVDAWLAWRMYGAPEPLDPVLDELAPAFDDILLHASLIDPVRMPPGAPSAFQLIAEPTLCGGNPFAADTPVGRFRSSVRGRSF
ncbi:MAG TPA: hypothetical protein VMN39_07965, partial [Longimicrobiaceae bacterium]|nr:hypothetical protein [Longimicrobiaceae bacterium]